MSCSLSVSASCKDSCARSTAPASSSAFIGFELSLSSAWAEPASRSSSARKASACVAPPSRVGMARVDLGGDCGTTPRGPDDEGEEEIGSAMASLHEVQEGVPEQLH